MRNYGFDVAAAVVIISYSKLLHVIANYSFTMLARFLACVFLSLSV